MKPSSRAVFGIVLASFFLSGVAGLVYQVVWTRYLSLFLGHTSYAVMAVLVAFMGGLAIGNAWLGPKVDTLRRPLLLYAGLEVAIGVYALLFPSYFALLESVFPRWVTTLKPGPGMLLLLKGAFAAVAILPPTILMGATLPALTRYVTRALSELRGRVAALYAINSTGAVVGVLLADWWWIPAYGLESVVQAGAAMSLLIGVTAWVLGVREGDVGTMVAPVGGVPAGGGRDGGEIYTASQLRLAVIGIGISGFVAMLYEVAWTRLLGLALGSTTHAYSLMLVTFISGIAVGGWIICRWKPAVDTLTAFAWAELGLAGSLFLSLFLYERLPYWFIRIANQLNRTPEAYPLYELFQGVVCFGVMFVPAVCLGTTLPLASRVATVELARTGGSVGRVFAVNTLGTVLGAVLTGMVLLPALGLATTFGVGIGLNAAIGLLILGWNRAPRWRPGLLGPPALALVVAVGVAAQFSRGWDQSMGFGAWRMPVAPTSWAEFQRLGRELVPLYLKHGAGSTVSVLQQGNPAAGGELSLRVNGKPDASTGQDMSTQLLLGHMPMLLHSNATEVLVIGCGSGVTAGVPLRYPGVTRVDLVEILPEVVEVARRFFAPFNGKALEDPRVQVHIEDAKTFLKTTPAKYDVVVAEPSNPWMAGVAAVFSQEFYEDCRRQMKPGGVMVQWLQAYETDDAIFEMVVGTFGSVFPFMSVWEVGPGDVLLLGTTERWAPDVEAAAKRFAVPEVKADLARIQITRFPVLLGLQHVAFGDGAFLAPEGTPVHSDLFPRLEYAAQRAFFARRSSTRFRRVSELRSVRPRTLLGDWLAKHPFDPGDLGAYVGGVIQPGMLDDSVNRGYLLRCLAMQPTNTFVLKALTEMAGRSPASEAEMERLAARPEMQAEEALQDVNLLRQYAGLLLLVHRAQRSVYYQYPNAEVELFARVAVKLDEAEKRLHLFHLAEVLCDRGKLEEFESVAATAFGTPPGRAGELSRDPDAARVVLTKLLELHLSRNDPKAALKSIELAMRSQWFAEADIDRLPRLGMLVRRVLASNPTVPGP